MTATTYIILANCAVIIGIGGYCAFLWKNNMQITKRTQQLELLRSSDEQ